MKKNVYYRILYMNKLKIIYMFYDIDLVKYMIVYVYIKILSRY